MDFTWIRKDGNPEVSRKPSQNLWKKTSSTWKSSYLFRARDAKQRCHACAIFILEWRVSDSWFAPSSNRENNQIMNVMKENDAVDPSLIHGIPSMLQKVWPTSWDWGRLVFVHPKNNKEKRVLAVWANIFVGDQHQKWRKFWFTNLDFLWNNPGLRPSSFFGVNSYPKYLWFKKTGAGLSLTKQDILWDSHFNWHLGIHCPSAKLIWLQIEIS